MRKILCPLVVAFACALAAGQMAGIDTERSKLTIHVEKTGLFSAFAHNHIIEAPIASGQLDSAKRTVILTFNAKDMKVLDPGVKDSERAEIDQTMKSDKVLDAQRFPEIRFASTSVTAQDNGRYQVRGDLTLHGVTKEVAFNVDGPSGVWKDQRGGLHVGARATTTISRKDFGLTWNKMVEGGGVLVSDDVDITINLEMLKAAPASATPASK